VTKFAPHKTSNSIASGTLPFDERAVVHHVVLQRMSNILKGIRMSAQKANDMYILHTFSVPLLKRVYASPLALQSASWSCFHSGVPRAYENLFC
jgi:hypothetical protein